MRRCPRCPVMSCRAVPGSRSAPCPAASRPDCRSCCSSWPARRCCCSTSRPTTWTCPAPRRCSRAWSPTRARSSRSRTTAGSPGRSSGSSSSPRTATSARPPNPPGTEPAAVPSAADAGAAAGAEVRAGREFGAALRAVLDGGRERLTAAHAELRPRRVRCLAGRAHRAGRGLLGRRSALRLAAVLGPAGTALTVGDTVLGRGLLGGLGLGRLLGLHLLRAERAGQPESGTEERSVGRAAALGHALARAERHLAGRVVLEAAGQLGVAGVLGQLLKLLLVLGGEVDVEVAHPGQLHAVGDELAVGGVDGGLLDLR